MFYSSPETWMHVTQMQRSHWPPRFECTWCIIHAVHRLQINLCYLFIYSLIIIALFLCWLIVMDCH